MGYERGLLPGCVLPFLPKLCNICAHGVMGHSYRATPLPNYNQRHDNFTCQGDIVHNGNGTSLLFNMSAHFPLLIILDSVRLCITEQHLNQKQDQHLSKPLRKIAGKLEPRVKEGKRVTIILFFVSSEGFVLIMTVVMH